MRSDLVFSYARRFTTLGLGATLLTLGACDPPPVNPEGTGSSTTASTTPDTPPAPTAPPTLPGADSSGTGSATTSATGSGSTTATEGSTSADPTTSGGGSTGDMTRGSDSSTTVAVDPTSTTGSSGGFIPEPDMGGGFIPEPDVGGGFIPEPDVGGGFIVDPDGGGPFVECDLWEQDCPVGDKCMPWANDGGGSWNATRCSPVDDMPVGTGEACMAEGSGTSGIDNCQLGAMCWDIDPETNIGTCVEMCTGSPEAPICEPVGTSCVIANDGIIILCLPGCDPLIQDCDDGQGCYAVGDAFNCAPDASGELGLDGDGCAFINGCDPGLFCSGPDALDGCFDGVGCCTLFCDTTAGDCPSPIEECIPFYEPGLAPPGLEDVGTCLIPA